MGPTIIILLLIAILFYTLKYNAKLAKSELSEQEVINSIKARPTTTEISFSGPPNAHLKYFLETKVGYFSETKTLEEARFISRLVEPEGRLNKWTSFRDTVLERMPYYHTDVLKIEFNLFFGMAQSYVSWRNIEQDKKIFAYLKYDAVKDSVTCSTCKKLHGIIRPVDDEFWDTYFPPNCQECRCCVMQYDSDEVKHVTDLSKKKLILPDPKFALNIGKHELKLYY